MACHERLDGPTMKVAEGNLKKGLITDGNRLTVLCGHRFSSGLADCQTSDRMQAQRSQWLQASLRGVNGERALIVFPLAPLGNAPFPHCSDYVEPASIKMPAARAEGL